MRDQLRRELRRMQAMGRSLLLQQRIAVSGRWWRGTSWMGIKKATPGWVLALVERWKKLIERIEEQAEEIEAELRAGAPLQELLFGESELTHELLARELIDPQRFRNARQVGNSFGLCPSESSSAERRRLGSITKHGNPRLRRLMVELAWRISRFQPRSERCAAGPQSSTGPKPVPPPARKPLWRSRALWPSTFGGLPLVGSRPKNWA